VSVISAGGLPRLAMTFPSMLVDDTSENALEAGKFPFTRNIWLNSLTGH
jgi:hypothetical protein